jgi:hypothetical protein
MGKLLGILVFDLVGALLIFNARPKPVPPYQLVENLDYAPMACREISVPQRITFVEIPFVDFQIKNFVVSDNRSITSSAPMANVYWCTTRQ